MKSSVNTLSETSIVFHYFLGVIKSNHSHTQYSQDFIQLKPLNNQIHFLVVIFGHIRYVHFYCPNEKQ